MLNKTISKHPLAELTSHCLDQLEREEANLRATIECLRDIRQCAIENDLDKLTRLLRSHEQLQAAADALAGDRRELRRRLAAVLDVPLRQATVRSLSQLAPGPEAQKLLACRQRLILLVKQANSLGQSIVMLVQQSMNLMKAFLECFTGETINEGYTRSGSRENQQSPPILKFRC